MSKFLEFITELIGWCQIVLSPLLIGSAIGFVIYLNKTDAVGLIIGIILSAAGSIVGIILATRAWRKKGTMSFLSKVSATPELDVLNREDKAN